MTTPGFQVAAAYGVDFRDVNHMPLADALVHPLLVADVDFQATLKGLTPPRRGTTFETAQSAVGRLL